MSYSTKRYRPGDLVWTSEISRDGVVEAGVIMSFPDPDFNYEIAFPKGVRLSNEAFLHKTKDWQSYMQKINGKTFRLKI